MSARLTCQRNVVGQSGELEEKEREDQLKSHSKGKSLYLGKEEFAQMSARAQSIAKATGEVLLFPILGTIR